MQISIKCMVYNSNKPNYMYFTYYYYWYHVRNSVNQISVTL